MADAANPQVLATLNVTLDPSSTMPYTVDLPFSQSSTHVRVKKTLFLSAIDTAASDFASAGLISQDFVPEPGSVLLLLLAGVPGFLLRRR